MFRAIRALSPSRQVLGQMEVAHFWSPYREKTGGLKK